MHYASANAVHERRGYQAAMGRQLWHIVPCTYQLMAKSIDLSLYSSRLHLRAGDGDPTAIIGKPYWSSSQRLYTPLASSSDDTPYLKLIAVFCVHLWRTGPLARVPLRLKLTRQRPARSGHWRPWCWTPARDGHFVPHKVAIETTCARIR